MCANGWCGYKKDKKDKKDKKKKHAKKPKDDKKVKKEKKASKAAKKKDVNEIPRRKVEQEAAPSVTAPEDIMLETRGASSLTGLVIGACR